MRSMDRRVEQERRRTEWTVAWGRDECPCAAERERRGGEVVGCQPRCGGPFVRPGERGGETAFGRGFEQDEVEPAARPGEGPGRDEAARSEGDVVGRGGEGAGWQSKLGGELGERPVEVDGGPANGDEVEVGVDVNASGRCGSRCVR